MNKVILGILPCIFIIACTASDVPKIEESDALIEQVTPKLALMEDVVSRMNRPPAAGRDITLRVNTRALNALLAAISGNRSDDIRLKFLQSPRIIEERKSALGIPYTNFVSIDSGAATVNLRHLLLRNARRNTLTMVLQADGTGKVHITGKYTAITASASPNVSAQLSDSVRFILVQDDKKGFRLEPSPGTMQLRTTISIELLGWEVPYARLVPLRTEQVIPSLEIPFGVSRQVSMPVPNETVGDKFVQTLLPVRMEDIATSIANNWIEMGFNIGIGQDRTP